VAGRGPDPHRRHSNVSTQGCFQNRSVFLQ
jgi:hypothetical protein